MVNRHNLATLSDKNQLSRDSITGYRLQYITADRAETAQTTECGLRKITAEMDQTVADSHQHFKYNEQAWV